ncbi:MAG: YigZ family protein [Oscillospiraceae bacterium]|nr:YigZ family protein [Oscillospiraceae bacterium]
MNGYLVPAAFGQAEFTEKRSRFIGRVWPVSTEEEALTHIKEMRELHFDASHNVYAYSIKRNGITRYTDDREPTGTAGMPVLNVFRALDISDFLCVVTRYFGGTLLGTGGLTRAYSHAAALALESAGRAQMLLLKSVSVQCPYNLLDRMRQELGRCGGREENTVFGADVTVYAAMTEQELEEFRKRVTELTSGRGTVNVLGEGMRPVKIQD